MTERNRACCTSPAAIGYWFAASLIAWGALSLTGVYWHPLRALSAPTILFAMAFGCVANWLRNRTFHCGVTGPIFSIAAILFLLSDLRVTRVNELLVWPLVFIGVSIAFLLEWRYTSTQRLRR
jgi:hypothetical protein